MKIKWAFI